MNFSRFHFVFVRTLRCLSVRSSVSGRASSTKAKIVYELKSTGSSRRVRWIFLLALAHKHYCTVQYQYAVPRVLYLSGSVWL